MPRQSRFKITGRLCACVLFSPTPRETWRPRRSKRRRKGKITTMLLRNKQVMLTHRMNNSHRILPSVCEVIRRLCSPGTPMSCRGSGRSHCLRGEHAIVPNMHPRPSLNLKSNEILILTGYFYSENHSIYTGVNISINNSV